MALLAIQKNARDIGACIYCGAVDEPLQTEHAVPYGLNGSLTLLRASCAKCAVITTRFERDALKSLWPSIRTVLEMRTRRRHPATLPLVLETGGVQRTIEVSPPDYPLYLPLPHFPPPGAIAGPVHPPGAPSFELRFHHIAGPTFEAAARHHAADFVGARLTFSPQYFARMLAKIGSASPSAPSASRRSGERRSAASFLVMIRALANGLVAGAAILPAIRQVSTTLRCALAAPTSTSCCGCSPGMAARPTM